MSWDPIWEEIFRTRDWGRYPPEELVRFVARHFSAAPARKEVKVLELGCGIGANVWYLAREGFDAYGVDGSPTAIHKAQQRLRQEGLEAHLQVGDAAALRELYPAARFDAVIEVGCLVCNRMDAVRSIVEQATDLLKPGGHLFSMTMATGTHGDGLGRQVEPGTYVDVTEGPLAGKGLVHFFSREEVEGLFGRLADVQIEYSLRSMGGGRHVMKHWVAEGVKPR